MMKQKQFHRRKLVMFRQWSNKRYAAFNSMRKIVKICTLALAYSIVATPVHVKAEGGDTTGLKTLEIDEVTVQSTLIELKNAETGRSIDVINGAQIQSLPVTSIDELLRYIPGIDAQQRGAFGTQADFSLRGSNFNQVLVLVDGQKINDPNTAHFNSNIPITPSEIERIEIIHGPASAEYGPDATGGVINIITKTFSKTAQPDNTSADGKIMLGQYKLINSSGGFFYKKDKLSISEGALLSKSDGNPQSSGTKGWFDINSYSLSGKYDISNSWSASYRYAHDVRDFNSRWYYSDSPLDSSREKVTRDMHQFQVIRKNENSSTVISGSNISTNDIFNFNPAFPLSINNTTFSNLQATHQFEALGNSKILFGAVLNQRSIESNNRGNHDLMHYGLFSTLSEKISESLTINGGIRAEYEKIYNLQFIPQLSIAYRLNNNCIFRASAGRSIRAADFTENYYNNYVPGIVAPGNRIGNPDLKPENSWNAELGADYNFLPGFYLSATGFGRFAQNMIDYMNTRGDSIWNNTNLNKTGYYFYATNSSKVNTTGVDLKISGRKKLGKNSRLYFLTGYTFLNISSTENTNSLYYLLHAKHLVNGEVGINYGFIDFNLNGLYKVRNSQTSINTGHSLSGEYTVWNGNIDCDIFKKSVFLTCAVNNIFNEKYSDFLGAEMPGRWIAFGLKMKL